MNDEQVERACVWLVCGEPTKGAVVAAWSRHPICEDHIEDALRKGYDVIDAKGVTRHATPFAPASSQEER